jgi:pyruvate/2-oxoglutarate dehydrogenase complex dihydrolipoamide dehydrogenase (E3) component
MSGDCLNYGCVPSKAILETAKVAALMHRAPEFGLGQANVGPKFKDVMQRVQNIIEEIEPHDSVERYCNLGVDCLQGEAEIFDPHTVLKVGDIVAGACPFVPPIPGINDSGDLTSDPVWS